MGRRDTGRRAMTIDLVGPIQNLVVTVAWFLLRGVLPPF